MLHMALTVIDLGKLIVIIHEHIIVKIYKQYNIPNIS